MLDKYDIRYGIRKHTKENFLYWIYTLIFSFAMLYIFKSKNKFFHFEIPNNLKEFGLFSLSILPLGLIISLLMLVISFFLDISHFKSNQKKYFVRGRILNYSQKERVLKKLYIKKELCLFILKPDESYEDKISEKQWNYYTKKLGSKKEIISRLKFLNYLENQIIKELPLKDQEITYLNNLMFSTDDITLYQDLKENVLNKRS